MRTVAEERIRPSIIGAAAAAWRDAFTAFGQMPTALGVAALAVLASEVVKAVTILRDPASAGGLAVEIFDFALGLVQGLLLTPAAIAVHRFILLDEKTTRYRLDLSHSRFRQFFFFTVMLQILLTIPGTVVTVGTKASGWVAALSGLAGCVLGVLAIITMLRTLILFPAIAVDAPGADWANALRDSKGHSWRLLFIFVAVGLPIFAVYVPIVVWIGEPFGQSLALGAALAIVEAAVSVLVTAIYAALASRLFIVLADRLGRPPGISESLSRA